MLKYQYKDILMASTRTTRKKAPNKIETYDESDSIWYSFVEIIEG